MPRFSRAATGSRRMSGEQAAVRLARYTGLDAAEIETHQLRIDHSLFCKELLKSRRRSIGRYDARYQGIENLTPAESGGPSFDPSFAAVRAPYTATFYRYIRDRAGLQERRPVLHPRRAESASGTSRTRWDTRRRPTP